MRFNPFTQTGIPVPTEQPLTEKKGKSSKPAKATSNPEPKAKKAGARKRKQGPEVTALQREALQRAQCERSLANYGQIIAGFSQKGIPAHEIIPRVNVFTFSAWKAKGRKVRKGEHGVKISSWIPTGRTHTEKNQETGEEETVARLRPFTPTVFHISQTEPMEEGPDQPATPTQAVTAPTASIPDPVKQEQKPVAPAAPEAPKKPAWLLRRIGKA